MLPISTWVILFLPNPASDHVRDTASGTFKGNCKDGDEGCYDKEIKITYHEFPIVLLPDFSASR
jgi:hypothetical protein